MHNAQNTRNIQKNMIEKHAFSLLLSYSKKQCEKLTMGTPLGGLPPQTICMRTPVKTPSAQIQLISLLIL